MLEYPVTWKCEFYNFSQLLTKLFKSLGKLQNSPWDFGEMTLSEHFDRLDFTPVTQASFC